MKRTKLTPEYRLKCSLLAAALRAMPDDLKSTITTANRVERPLKYYITGEPRLEFDFVRAAYVVTPNPKSNA